MKKSVKNVPASIRARLQNVAKETGRPFSEVLRKTYRSIKEDI